MFKAAAVAALAQAIEIDAESRHDKLWINAKNASRRLYKVDGKKPEISVERFNLADYVTDMDAYAGELAFSTPPNMGTMVFEKPDFKGKNMIFYTGDARKLKKVPDSFLSESYMPSFYWTSDLAQPADLKLRLFESEDCSLVNES